MSWIDRELNKRDTTVSRSRSQEKQVAKSLKGRLTVNSGATFAENDVVSKELEIECKITAKPRYSVSVKEWEKLQSRTDHSKTPAMVIYLNEGDTKLAVIDYDDFLRLTGNKSTLK